jgi:hypothetical protein
MNTAQILDSLLIARGVNPIAVGNTGSPITPLRRAAAELKSLELTLRLDLRELGRLALKGSPEVAAWNRLVEVDETRVAAARAALADADEPTNA